MIEPADVGGVPVERWFRGGPMATFYPPGALLESLARFLSHPPSLRRVAALRIGLGFVVLSAYLHTLPGFFAIYGEDGFAAGASLLPWKLHDGVQALVVVLLLLGSLGMIWGVSARTATAVVWSSHSWLWLSNSSYYWSWGLLLSDFLFFLMFFIPPSRASIGGPGAGFWFRMFQVQVCFVYLLSCVYRYDSRAWLRGEAFHVAMADTIFGRFTFLDWYSYYPVTAPLSYGAWAVESMAGLFLLFHKRIGPYLVLALTGIHVVLQLTTMVQSWQVLMIVALMAFWPEAWLGRAEAGVAPRRAEPGRSGIAPLKSNMLAIGFLTLWISVLIPNVPIEWSERYIKAARRLLFPVHALFGLGGTYGMRMFARPDRRGNACMIALGLRDAGGGSELLFEPPVKDCFNPGVRVLQNDVHHAFFKYYRMLMLPGTPYRVYRKGKGPEQFQMDLGDVFCRRSRVEGRPVDYVFVGMFREMYHPEYRSMQRGVSIERRRRLMPGLGYDCHRRALVPISGPSVFAALEKDHPAVYDTFQDYQSGH